VVIVQHKHESRHPFGTVRIAELGLARARVHTVPGWAVSDRTPPSWLPAHAGLLYPGPGARPLETLAPEQHPGALVILDGTWHQARALFRDHAWVRNLPRYSLTPP
jgi:DTW domain-containing protein YfiP